MVGDADLVAVVAPAGYGKTTFATQWAVARRLVGETTIWLDLSAAHADPAYLLKDLAQQLAASNTTNDQIDRGPLDAIAGQEALFAGILDRLGETGRTTWVVLNDLHLIDGSGALDYLRRLVDTVGPTLKLLVTCRREPSLSLARLAAQGRVCWITESQLAFTSDEIRAVADCANPKPPTEAVAALANSGNGWPIFVGVAIAALRTVSPSTLVLGTAGIATQGVIRAFVRELMHEFVRDEVGRRVLEVLAALEEVPEPLLTSLVPEESDGDARRQILGSGLISIRQSSPSGAVIQLHPVVREIVRQEFGTNSRLLIDIPRRAATWYWKEGERDRAIAAAVAAGDGEQAAAWLAEHTDELVWHRGLLETFLHHFDRIPEAARTVVGELAVTRAWALISLRRYGEAERAIALIDSRHESLRRLLLGVMAVLQDDAATALSLLPALQIDDPAWTKFEGGVAALAIAYCFRARGELVQAHVALRQALAAFAAEGATYGRIWVSVFEALLLLKEGRFRQALAECAAAGALSKTSVAFDPLRGMLHSVEALARYERGDLEGARAALDDGLRLLYQQGLVDAVIAGYVAAARVHAAEGSFADALDLIAEGERIGYERGFVRLEETLRAERVVLLIRSGDVVQARTLAMQAGFLPLAQASNPLRLDKGIRIAARLARHAEGGVDRCELDPRLDAAIERARQTGQHYKLAELLLLRAMMAAHDRDGKSARREILEALAIASAEGFLRLFVDEGLPARKLLARLGNSVKSTTSATLLRQILQTPFHAAAAGDAPQAAPFVRAAEPLSERELQVLRLVAAGCPNGTIAKRMFLTEGTVKWHLHNIYGKLGVCDRRSAVEAAQRMGIPLPRRD